MLYSKVETQSIYFPFPDLLTPTRQFPSFNHKTTQCLNKSPVEHACRDSSCVEADFSSDFWLSAFCLVWSHGLLARSSVQKATSSSFSFWPAWVEAPNCRYPSWRSYFGHWGSPFPLGFLGTESNRNSSKWWRATENPWENRNPPWVVGLEHC